MSDKLQYMEIKTWGHYGDFCSYIEEDKPSISEICQPYLLTEHYKIKIYPEFNFVFDDVVNYIMNPEIAQSQPVVETSGDYFKFTPVKTLTIEGFPVNFY